ncbi:alpha/beta hydrolase [Streptomyces sp. SID6673]|nr:alpha/beta hydrolase [Streptomyces sp. SID11726]NEB26152.1 alpha/beta hydrolase [Streptomyces sp. SID6673]
MPPSTPTWNLDHVFRHADGDIRWRQFGEQGPPIVLVHGTPYSSFLWRDIAPALARTRRVIVFDHLGYGQSDKSEMQDLTLAAQARRFAALLSYLGVERPRVAANDIGGAITLRALLVEGVRFSDMTLFDCVSGGQWEGGLFGQIRQNPEVFAQLPGYAHRALVASHLRHATYAGFRPGVLDAYLAPWLGEAGQAAFYRQYRQLSEADTDDYSSLLGDVDIPVRLLWGCDDRILPPRHGEWLRDHIRHESMTWIENAGHLLQEDAPAQLLAVLEQA